MSSSNVEKLKALIEIANKSNINIRKLPVIKNHRALNGNNFKWISFVSIVIVGIASLLSYKVWLHDGKCLVSLPDSLSRAFRPPEDCGFCRNITKADRVSNISPHEFERKYAYNAKPVIVTDATVNWTALDVFDFWYFKDVYEESLEDGEQLNCQFFPYKTEFRSLREALDMPPERVNYEPGTKPWYFGWSNCNYEVAQELRKHYGRPYFLPELSENNAVDWIFMGGSNLGAHMHVDNVRLPSWQAQIKGTKQWVLAPPPECYYECSTFDVTVQTGDIIVLDTNKWYHKTNVMPGEISITIGAEYD